MERQKRTALPHQDKQALVANIETYSNEERQQARVWCDEELSTVEIIARFQMKYGKKLTVELVHLWSWPGLDGYDSDQQNSEPS